ncbi:MAG: low molecular weight phosphotyrosine protein phosphatase [Bacteroidetes bacterium]|nr:low molecular weight phosphotyrosine protein phosphatase [Bacteroidota bacterium]
MVCLGNICRSPMAEGIFRKHAEKIGSRTIIDSCGTSDYHVGESPDYRAVKTLERQGIDISGLAARQFMVEDFDRFDHIFAMDVSNLMNVLALARNDSDRSKVSLLLDEIYPGENRSVPDPYFGGIDGFDEVYRMIDRAAESYLEKNKV